MDLAIGARQTLRDDDAARPRRPAQGRARVQLPADRSSAASAGSTPTARCSWPSRRASSCATCSAHLRRAAGPARRPAARRTGEEASMTRIAHHHRGRHRRRRPGGPDAGPPAPRRRHRLGRVDLRTPAEIEQTHRAGSSSATACGCSSSPASPTGCCATATSTRASSWPSAAPPTGSTSRVGRRVPWLYPQTDVFIDLADARARDGGDVRYRRHRHVGRRGDQRPTRRCGSPTPPAPSTRSAAGCWSARTARAACAAPVLEARGSTSGSTRSPGSASSARRRRARPS